MTRFEEVSNHLRNLDRDMSDVYKYAEMTLEKFPGDLDTMSERFERAFHYFTRTKMFWNKEFMKELDEFLANLYPQYTPSYDLMVKVDDVIKELRSMERG